MPAVRELTIASALAAAVLWASPAAAIDVTTCGQVLPDGETGVLTGDLDCSSSGLPSAVVLGKLATLDLQGHVLTGPGGGGGEGWEFAAIRCDLGPRRCHDNYATTICRSAAAPCTVTSSMGIGVIRGYNGISADRNLIASNLRIEPTLSGIILREFGGLLGENLELLDGAQDGIHGIEKSTGRRAVGARLRLQNVMISGFGGYGIFALAGSLQAANVTSTGNGHLGILASSASLRSVTANDNGAASADRPYECAGGICGARISLDDCSFTGNTYQGVPMDVIAWFKPPKAQNTVCGVSGKTLSYDGPPVDTWGICAND